MLARVAKGHPVTMRFQFTSACGVAVNAALALGSLAIVPAAHAGLEIVPLVVPANAPAAQPSVAVDRNGRFFLSWQERRADATTLKLASWDGAAVGATRTVASGPSWFVNWADFPSLAVLDDGELVAHWLQKSAAATYAYDVMLVRSRDQGRHWSEPVRLHDDGTTTEHGFVALLPLPDAQALVAWLDGRHTAGKENGDGVMSLRAAVFDRRGARVAERELDDMTCDCCQTDAARTHDGAVLVYRDRSAGEVRDISAVRWTAAGFDQPTPVYRDGWVMPACPVNGPAVAARGDDVVVAWYTEGDPGARVAIARSHDGGRRYAEPVVLEHDAQGRVDVAMLVNGDVLATWLAPDDGGTVLRLARLDGTLRELERHVVTRLPRGRSTGFPRLAAHANEAVLVWTASQGGDPSIAAVRITLARTE